MCIDTTVPVRTNPQNRFLQEKSKHNRQCCTTDTQRSLTDAKNDICANTLVYPHTPHTHKQSQNCLEFCWWHEKFFETSCLKFQSFNSTAIQSNHVHTDFYTNVYKYKYVHMYIKTQSCCLSTRICPSIRQNSGNLYAALKAVIDY